MSLDDYIEVMVNYDTKSIYANYKQFQSDTVYFKQMGFPFEQMFYLKEQVEKNCGLKKDSMKVVVRMCGT